jgi:hypothetical protein
MTVRPTHILPSVSLAEMEFLVTRTGLTLNAGQMADLVLAWRQVSALIATIPRETKPADDCAFVFRLPPPIATPASKPAAVRRAAPKVAVPKAATPARAAAAKAPAAKTPAAKARTASARTTRTRAVKPAANRPATGKPSRPKPRSKR